MTPPAGHPIISPSGIPSAGMVFRILHPNLTSTLWDASPLARIAEPRMAYGAKKRPRLGRCWSSLPSSLRLCRLRCSSSSSRSLAG